VLDFIVLNQLDELVALFARVSRAEVVQERSGVGVKGHARVGPRWVVRFVLIHCIIAKAGFYNQPLKQNARPLKQ